MHENEKLMRYSEDGIETRARVRTTLTHTVE